MAMVAVVDPLPSVTQSLTDDGHYHVKVRWGDFEAEFRHSEYPEDDAAYQLYDWGHRGTFSMRWVDGGVATFVRSVKRPGNPLEPSTAEHYEDGFGPTPGALQGDDYPIEMDADGYPIMPACLRRPQSGHDEEEEIELTMPPDAEEAA